MVMIINWFYGVVDRQKLLCLISNRDHCYQKSSRPEMFCKKGVLRNFTNFTGKYLCQSLFLKKVPGLRDSGTIKKETLAQLFSCKFCEISKNTLLQRTPRMAASVTKAIHRHPKHRIRFEPVQNLIQSLINVVVKPSILRYHIQVSLSA